MRPADAVGVRAEARTYLRSKSGCKGKISGKSKREIEWQRQAQP
jgi:hypothetical protein